jgi:hypothetical protein
VKWKPGWNGSTNPELTSVRTKNPAESAGFFWPVFNQGNAVRKTGNILQFKIEQSISISIPHVTHRITEGLIINHRQLIRFVTGSAQGFLDDTFQVWPLAAGLSGGAICSDNVQVGVGGGAKSRELGGG